MSEERYQIIKRVGEGGQGAVYLGYDQQLKREVAIKRLSQGNENGAVNPDEERLGKEAALLASLNHPNIVAVFDVAKDEDGLFMVMEKVQGPNLAELRLEGLPDISAFIQVASGLLDALVAAHSRSILHRDIKPENIHVTKGIAGKLQAKLLDFGLARASGTALKQTLDGKGNVMGTIHYMAPEQFLRQPLDARTDLYMLGCTLYEYLSGVKAFDAETVAGVMDRHIYHQVSNLNELRTDAPETLCQWVMWMMNRDPNDRPESAAQALASLNSILNPPAQLIAPSPASEVTRVNPSRPVAAPPKQRPVAVTLTKAQSKSLPWPAMIIVGAVVLSSVAFFIMRSARVTPPLLPVTEGITLQFDASNLKSVKTDTSGAVMRWEGAGSSQLHGAPLSAKNAPQVLASAQHGLPVMDFGPAGKNHWMEFRDQQEASFSIKNLRSAFWVMKGSGLLLGDSAAYEFHRGLLETKPDGIIFSEKYVPKKITQGTLRLNGVAVDGTKTPLPVEFSLISLVTTAGCTAGRLCSDRIQIDRSGGQQIAEILIYDRPLTQEEVKRVEDYLKQKWFGL